MFHDRFPDLAERETRTLTVLDDPDLPLDTYALIELYCDEPGCDCRRVMFNIFADRRKEFVAVIAYGWESTKFYRAWAGENEPKVINELKGPILNLLSPQSELAPALLQKVENVILHDPLYIERLKRHYRLFRETVEREDHATAPLTTSKKTGRNDPCPCGSGRKYKYCCMNTRPDS
jgi:hypothetical protein